MGEEIFYYSKKNKKVKANIITYFVSQCILISLYIFISRIDIKNISVTILIIFFVLELIGAITTLSRYLLYYFDLKIIMDEEKISKTNNLIKKHLLYNDIIGVSIHKERFGVFRYLTACEGADYTRLELVDTRNKIFYIEAGFDEYIRIWIEIIEKVISKDIYIDNNVNEFYEFVKSLQKR